MKNTKKMIALASVGGFLIFAGACSNKAERAADQSSVTSKQDGSGTAPPAAAAKQMDMALVRFVNGTTESKDLAFGDAMPFTGVGSMDVTAYKELPAERHDFKLMAEDNKTTPLATNSEGLDKGSHYTIFAYTQRNGKVNLDPTLDNLTPPDAGQAKVRVVNLAPSMDNADLYVQGQKTAIISGAGFEHATDYKNVPPTSAELMIGHGMSKHNSSPVKNADLKAGKLYTIIVLQGKNHKLSTKIVEDQINAVPAGM